MACNPFDRVPGTGQPSRSAKKTVKNLAAARYGKDGEFELQGQRTGGILPEGIGELYDGLRSTYDDAWTHSIRDHDNTKGVRSQEYVKGIETVLHDSVTQGKFGAAGLRNLVNATISNFSDEERGVLSTALRAFRQDGIKKFPKIAQQATAHTGGIPSVKDLQNAGLDDDAIEAAGEFLTDSGGVDSFLAAVTLGRVNLDKFIDESQVAALTKTGAKPRLGKQGRDNLISHIQSLTNVVSDSIEARYGTETAERLFSPEGLDGTLVVNQPNITGRVRNIVDAVINDPLHPLGTPIRDLRLKPEVIARIDAELRTNPRKPTSPGVKIPVDTKIHKVKDAAGREVNALVSTGKDPLTRPSDVITKHVIDTDAINLEHFMGSTEQLKLIAGLQKLAGATVDPEVTARQVDIQAFNDMQEIIDPADPDTWRLHMMDSPAEVKEGTVVRMANLQVAQWGMTLYLNRVTRLVETLHSGKISDQGLEDLAQTLEDVDTFRKTVSRYRSDAGRQLQATKRPITAPPSDVFGEQIRDYEALVKEGQALEGADEQFRRQFTPDLPENQSLTADELRQAKLNDPSSTVSEGGSAVDRFGGRKKFIKYVDDLDSVFKAKDSPEAQLKAFMAINRSVQKDTIIDGLKEFRFGAMLSSIRTPVINTVGSLGTAYARQISTIVGSAFRGDRGAAVRAVNELSALNHELMESWEYVKMAWRQGPRLEPKRGIEGFQGGEGVISTKSNLFEAFDGNIIGSAINFIGKQVRLPGRIMQTSDDAIKQIQYRSQFQGEIAQKLINDGEDVREAWKTARGIMDQNHRNGQAYGYDAVRRQGLALAEKDPSVAPGQINEYATEYANKNYDPILGNLSKRSVDVANQITFQTKLRPGTVAHSLAKASQTNWVAHMALPFVRTPTNILHTTYQHFDFIAAGRYAWAKGLGGTRLDKLKGSHNKFLQDMLSGDPQRAAEATGRVSMGLMAGTAVGFAYSSGNITGGGPDDPKKKAAWKQAGWRPYSIKTPDGWVSYERLDPLAGILGIASDFYEYMSQETEDFGDISEVTQTIIPAIGIAIAENVSNKTYLSGLSDILSALQDPRNAGRTAGALLGSFVPSIEADVARALDPHEREVRSMVDAVRKRVIGMRTDLPIRRNMFGEDVGPTENLAHAALGEDSGVARWIGMAMPIAYSTTSDSLVDQEVAQLGRGFAPPSSKRGGVDLREMFVEDGEQSAYDRWMELQGTIQFKDKTLKDAMRELIQDEEYQAIPPESDDEFESPRIGLLRNLIGRYRGFAFRQLEKEFPEIVENRVSQVRRKREALILGVGL